VGSDRDYFLAQGLEILFSPNVSEIELQNHHISVINNVVLMREKEGVGEGERKILSISHSLSSTKNVLCNKADYIRLV
jgi:hypothetical protein